MAADSMLPEGEGIRKALAWVGEQRRLDPKARLAPLVDEAAQRFDLSPLEADFLWRALTGAVTGG